VFVKENLTVEDVAKVLRYW